MNDTDVRAWYERWVEALNAHRLDGWDEFIADDVVIAGEATSREHVVTALAGTFDAVPDIQWKVTELLTEGDGIAVRAVSTGTPVKQWLGAAPTGKSFEMVEYVIYKVRDGRFVEMTGLQDSAEMVRQLAV